MLITRQNISTIASVLCVVFTLSTAGMALAATHTVEKGDTLWRISQEHGIEVTELTDRNGLVSTMIYPGDVLEIPVAPEGAPAKQPNTRRLNLTDPEYDLFVRMIAAEAGNEPYKGMVAVGAVILNRVSSPSFPNTVRGVLYQPSQFEPVQNGWLWRAKVTDAHRRAADEALDGADPTNGALYFFAHSKVRNAWLWQRPHKTTIGRHRFTA